MKRNLQIIVFIIVFNGILFPEIMNSQPISLGRTSINESDDSLHHTPDGQGKDPLGAGSAWFQEMKRDVSNDPADPNSDKMLNQIRASKGTIVTQWSGSWTPSDYGWYTFPFQVVSGNDTTLSIQSKWSYNTDTFGSYMLPPEPVVMENVFDTVYPTVPWSDGNDHHLCIYVRNEATGGYKELWEYYQPYVTKKGNIISAVAGASYRKFDLLNGEVPAADVPSVDAAGLMITPLLVRYDEVARDSINHALRFCTNNSNISPNYKWPARTAAGAWNPDSGMPYGTRLRIKSSWWNANADSILGRNNQARVIGEAMRRYGLILADGSSGNTIQLQGAADMRWNADILRLNAIPANALEVVSTPPLLQITGPNYLQVGDTGTWSVSFLPVESPVGVGSNINICDSTGYNIVNDGYGFAYAVANINEKQRSAVIHWAFNKTGTYIITPYASWNTGFGPFRIKVGSSPVPTINQNHEFSVPVVYPNPVSNTLTISGIDAGFLSVYDIHGNLQIQKEISKNFIQINVGSLPSAVYIIKITSDNSIKMVKFIKE